MKYFDREIVRPQIGLAYGAGMVEFAEINQNLIDYIELPFEQLRHSPSVGEIQQNVPIVLHCASLSVAGFVPPDDIVVDSINHSAIQTRTPWIGEHLAYVSADPVSEKLGGRGEPVSLTYTLCPQLSETTLNRVVENLSALKPYFPVPLILENSPQYFQVPGSTMRMTEFISEITDRCDVNLLLDLSHFVITAYNQGLDAFLELERFPLDRVIEVHISGMSVQSGIAWDDHSMPASSIVFDLLERLLASTRPRALTFEYNWSPDFPTSLLTSHVKRARDLMGVA